MTIPSSLFKSDKSSKDNSFMGLAQPLLGKVSSSPRDMLSLHHLEQRSFKKRSGGNDKDKKHPLMGHKVSVSEIYLWIHGTAARRLAHH